MSNVKTWNAFCWFFKKDGKKININNDGVSQHPGGHWGSKRERRTTVYCHFFSQFFLQHRAFFSRLDPFLFFHKNFSSLFSSIFLTNKKKVGPSERKLFLFLEDETKNTKIWGTAREREGGIDERLYTIYIHTQHTKMEAKGMEDGVEVSWEGRGGGAAMMRVYV